jgi:hypothetical protein
MPNAGMRQAFMPLLEQGLAVRGDCAFDARSARLAGLLLLAVIVIAFEAASCSLVSRGVRLSQK